MNDKGEAFVVWLTGLSGAGKSTLAHVLQAEILARGHPCVILDGDVLRQGLCRDLGFSESDRAENMRRAAELASLLQRQGVVVLVALISPFEKDRALARATVASGRFIEVWCAADLHACEQRDVKGLYRRARGGLLPGFTGIDSPYEPPTQPNVTLDTAQASVAQCCAMVLDHLCQVGLLQGGQAS